MNTARLLSSRISGLLVVIAALTAALTGCSQSEDAKAPQASSRPNVLLIVLDDFGFNDLAANGGSTSPTPNLDSFAASGVRYTRHYADTSCSVARAALLTGQYPAKFGFRPTHLGLSPDTTTIATLLRDAGYRTEHIGKWHVGNPTMKQSPLTVGFDQWFGFLLQHELRGASPDGIRYGRPTYRDPFLSLNDQAPTQYKGHLTDIFTDSAVTYLRDREGDSSPWFLNLWFFAPHTPVQPAARFAANHASTPEGKYSALIEQLDHSVGRVLQALQDSGHANNTLVIIVSDNGGTGRDADNNAPFHGHKQQLLEGGIRTPLLIRWPGSARAGAVVDETVSLYDLLPTIATAAGAAVPGAAIGRDLAVDSLPQGPQLFWDYSDSVNYKFSVLSEDERWRYTAGNLIPSTLNDLREDPSGATSVLDDHPEVAAQLVSQFQQWRLQQRIVALDYELLNQQGAARITGSDLLRSPGYRGFTVALGVTPRGQSAAMQTLAYQQDRWGAYSSADNLVVGVLGELIILPPLPVDTCSELVITTHFSLSPRQPRTNWSSIDVYVDGAVLESRRSEQPGAMYDGYHHPTYVGRDAEGEGVFQGHLSRAVIVSERLTAAPAGGVLRNAVADLEPLCAASPVLQ